MNPTLSKSEIENIVWRACDTFRGAIDPSEYKNYILTMLFVKYLSDLAKRSGPNTHSAMATRWSASTAL